MILSYLKSTVAASCSADKLDIAFIVDSSGSIRSKNYELVKNFVIEFIGMASIDDGTVRIGVITFATSVSVIAYMNSQTNATSLQEVVKNITYDRGYTNTAAGLWAANYKVFQRSNGDRSEVPNVAILIADGVSNVNVKETVPQANLLKATGAKIIALGVTTSNMTKDELDKLASLPLRDHRIDVDSFTQLAGLSNSILSVTCAGKTLIHIILSVAFSLHSLLLYKEVGTIFQSGETKNTCDHDV